MNFGKDYGKALVIVDIADENRVLVEGPTSGFPRVLYPLRRLTLTGMRLPILRGVRSGTLKKASDTFKLKEKFEQSSFAKRTVVRAKRANLKDLDRFKVMINRKNKSFKTRQLAKKIGGGAPVK